MKKVVVCILVMLFSVCSYGQELPSVIPSSPEARKMIEYGNIPVNYNTGVPNVNIPLYTLQAGSLNIPINLSYHAGGVRVNDPDGRVGLKWNLNNGSGMISRSIKGRPDESTRYGVNTGWLHSVYDINNLNQADKNSIANGCYDLEPDEFSYSLPNGISGKFIFSKNKEVIFIPQTNDVKIDIYDDYTLKNGFKITDKYGNIYEFKTEESINYKGTCSSSVLSTCPTEYNVPSSWKLDKVIYINGDNIEYTYTSDTYTESYIQSQSQVIRGQFPGDLPPVFFNLKTCYANNNFNLKPIEFIRYKDYEIIYSYSTKSSNIAGKKLDELQINYKGKQIKKIVFEYLFNTRGRMFLNSIIDQPNSKEENLIGAFEYTNYEEFPSISSLSKDHFGYYNGKINTQLIPSGAYKTSSSIGNIFIVNYKGADRSLNESTLRTGMLSKITHPTKGYTVFNYEPNIAYYGEMEEIPQTIHFNASADNNVSGWQIKQSNAFQIKKGTFTFKSLRVDNFDGIDINNSWQKPVVKLVNNEGVVYKTLRGDFFGENLNSDVVVNNLPVQSYKIQIEVYNHFNYEIACGVNGTYTTDNFIENKYFGGLRINSITNYSALNKKASEKSFEYQDFSSSTKSSGKVFGKRTSYETFFNFDGMSEGGIKPTYTRLSSSGLRAISYNQNAPVLYQNVKEIFQSDNNSYSIKRYFKDYGTNLWGVISPEEGMVIPYSIENYANGMLKREEYINTSGEIVRSIENDYEFINANDQFGYVAFCSPSANLLRCYTNEYLISSGWFVNKKVINTTYNSNGSIINTSESFYDNSSHKLPTRQFVTNSKGETFITETKYAHDVNNTKLVNEYRIAEPIEVSTTKKVGNTTTILSKQHTVYKDFAGIYLPEKVQTLKGGQALEDRVVFHSYDAKGNPVEVSKKDGTKIYYVWGYNQTQPIAKIEGYNSINNNQLSVINAAILASGLDESEATENTLRTNLTALRTAFPEAQVTSFTYDPLIGVTSITDPRGETIYYQYDNFNRLQFIKNAEGHILKEHQYNYKN